MQGHEISPCHQVYDITQLREIALAGDVNRIRAILPASRGNGRDNDRFVQNTATILFEAIENDSAEVVEALLDCDVPMNTRLFLKATRNTSYRILHAFLRHGWDINTPIDSYTPPTLAYRDCTPLSVAFREADFSIVKLLLERGASLQQGQVLHYAAMRELDDRLNVLEYLLRKGLSVNDIMYQNCGDEYYFNMYSGIGTPLHYAAARGLYDSVKLLIENGACPRIKDPGGRIALEWAEANGQSLVAEFLRPLSIDRGLEPASLFTAENGHYFNTVPMEKFLKESGYQLV